MATTEAPALAKLMAMPRPNPRLAPVTNAGVPASSCVAMTPSPAELLAHGRHYGPTPAKRRRPEPRIGLGRQCRPWRAAKFIGQSPRKSGDRADWNLLAVARVEPRRQLEEREQARVVERHD